MEIKHLKSAFRKLKRRQKRDGYYEASDILKAPEIESLVYLASIITIPIFVTMIVLLINY